MSESEEEVVFKINKAYADKYDTWRRKEEYQQLLDKYGEDALSKLDESSSSEEEDDTAQEITPEFEAQFLKALATVKTQDPKMYDKGVDLFQERDDTMNEGTSSSKTKKSKPMFLKDYERKIIVEKGGKYSDDESDGGEFDDEDRNLADEMPASPTYVEEQEQLKSSFKDALKDSPDESSDEETFLTQKRKTKEEKEREEEEYIKWLKGERQTLRNEEVKNKAKDVESLREYWSNPTLEEDEKFLRDYILDRAYKPRNGEEDQLVDLSDEDLSEDERLLDEQEEFERKFNFRYEEPDSEFVKSYPRNVAGSLRKKDTSRAKKRQEVKERKEKEKQKMQEELKKLKNLKKMEIIEKLEKLKKVTGNATVGFGEGDMGGDFDPDEHDRMMQKVFDDQYDEFDEDATKPVFDDEEFDEENWDEWTGHSNSHGDDASQLHCEDPGFNMDADYDPALHKREKKDKRKKKKDKKNKKREEEPPPAKAVDTLLEELDGRRQRQKHTSEFAKVIQNKRPVFDPEDKSFEEYFDEYYRLDYEDLIGDLPCRFKYRTVVANDFGLTTEEMLGADDKELNRWASLRKTCQYRTTNEEMSDLSSFQEKGQNVFKKQQVLQSIYNPKTEDEDEEQEEDSMSEEVTSAETLGEVKEKKRKKQKHNESEERQNGQEGPKKQAGGENCSTGGMVDILADDGDLPEVDPSLLEKKRERKKKRKREKHGKTRDRRSGEDSVNSAVNGVVATEGSEEHSGIALTAGIDGKRQKKRERRREEKKLTQRSGSSDMHLEETRVDEALKEDSEVLSKGRGDGIVEGGTYNSTTVEEPPLKKHKQRDGSQKNEKHSGEKIGGNENVKEFTKKSKEGDGGKRRIEQVNIGEVSAKGDTGGSGEVRGQDGVSKGARKRRAIQDLRDRKRRWKMAKRKEISEGRLRAYGIRPTAYKYKLIQERIKNKRRGKKVF